MTGFLGKKLGMTQVFNENGESVPVTVIQAGPCTVIQKKTKEKDGYHAVQLGFEEIAERKVSRPAKGHFTKRKLKPFRYLKEFLVPADAVLEEGQILTTEIFKVGDQLKITGISKGKGFQGVIKRWGKAGGPASHGSRFHRTTGSIGQRTSPGEVFKNMKLPGHMGVDQVTVRNLQIVQIHPQENLLFVRGAVPGANHNLVVMVKDK
ncbi:MAG: 50S ribosomal protein L3 [Deltaproteobacteria bacterium]|nr:50S ribosomal protein L3 [Deltaproteobacteria bacterium]